MTEPTEAIISIKPNFAEAIFSKTKTVELRRRVPMFPIGTRLWIYATLPVGAVLGTAEIIGRYEGTPDEIWETFYNEVGISRTQFDEYFEESQKAIGLVLSNVKMGYAASISTLRKLRPGFQPPQVTAKLTCTEASLLTTHMFGS